MTSSGIKTLNYPVAQSCHFVNVFSLQYKMSSVEILVQLAYIVVSEKTMFEYIDGTPI